ncbi:MAG: glycosyltransferase, partial [Bdellovibrionaceae bacterium]|nr:glycosyltransferase [Pseudobdellovibrionaceae bacterium]
MDLNRIVIAGGGTGGHIYPAVAIARAVQVLSPAAEITFVGAQGGLEERLIPREGFSLRLLSVGKLNQKEDGWIGKLRTLLRLPLAMFVSWKILREIQPQVVLGVGGYASGPFVLVASLLGYRTAIWEPNAHPGLTNRWLSRFVGKAYVVFREADRHLKCRKVMQIGMPVRP